MRRTRWLVALTAFGLLGTACVGGGDDGGDGTQPDAQQDLSGEQIEVAAVWSGPEQQRFRAVLDAFEEQTGATADFTSTGDDIAAVLGPRVEGGDPPDVAILPQPGLLRDFAGQDALIPIDDVVGDELEANFAPVFQELGSVDGTLYGLYWKMANKSTVWFNIHSFQNAGVEPPEDWDGLQQVAQTLSDSGVTPYSIGGGDGWTLSDWFENIYIRTAGADAYDQLTNHDIPWTDQSVKDALTVFADVVGNPDLIAGGTDGALQTDFTTSVTQVYANPQSPEAAIVYEGDFVAGEITGNTEAQLGTDADFFPFPEIEGSGPAVIGGGDAAVLMNDSEGGRALIEFLATPEAAEVWAAEGGFLSPNQNLDTSVYPDDITRRTAEALVEAAEAGNFRFDLSDLQPSEFGATTGEGIWGLLQEFVRNPDDVDGITQQLEQAASRAFG
ncbi:MAG TPA: ABC transporter substrate-binding protein [Actinomycetota bacterium]|nr:ABC transporter substrate-binding protein [Actinomycetota bacterium]